MAKISHHVVPGKDGGWDVKRGNAMRVSLHADTKAEAIKSGRAISQRAHSEFVIHGVDGKIQRSDSHGNDPCPPKDKK